MFCFSRRVSIWPAALLGSSVMLWTSLSELFPRAMDALRVVSFTRAATLATAALARAAVLLLTSNGVVSTGGVVTAVAVAASEWAEAETSAGNIGWPLSLLRLDEWSVMAESKKCVSKDGNFRCVLAALSFQPDAVGSGERWSATVTTPVVTNFVRSRIRHACRRV